LFCCCEYPSIFNDVADGKLCLNCGRPPAPVEKHAASKATRKSAINRSERRVDRSFARASRPWTAEEVEVLRGSLGLVEVAELARRLNRSPNSVKNKAVELHLSFATSPSNRHGRRLYWAEERVLEGLKVFIKETRGMLPTSDDSYIPLQKGRMDLPAAVYIYKYFGGMPAAFRAAGAPEKRLNFTNADWTPAEEDYLLEHAGSMRLVDIAQHLNRSYQAIRTRIGGKGLGITARANQGYLSAALLAQESNASCHRVRQLLYDGRLPGFYNKARHCWQVDLGDLTAEHKVLLTAPRDTHKNAPVDRGDYYQRYGLMRILVDGQLQRVPKETKL
jgi:hypothetical protein